MKAESALALLDAPRTQCAGRMISSCALRLTDETVSVAPKAMRDWRLPGLISLSEAYVGLGRGYL